MAAAAAALALAAAALALAAAALLAWDMALAALAFAAAAALLAAAMALAASALAVLAASAAFCCGLFPQATTESAATAAPAMRILRSVSEVMGLVSPGFTSPPRRETCEGRYPPPFQQQAQIGRAS